MIKKILHGLLLNVKFIHPWWDNILLHFALLNITQSFSYESHCKCYKKLASRSWPVLFTTTYFFVIHTVSSSTGKCGSCYGHCFPQQIRPQATVQWYILQECSSVRIGFSMINKCYTLPIVCSMLVKIL